MIGRPLTFAMFAVITALLQACVNSDGSKYCSFSKSPSLRKVDSANLGFVLGKRGAAAIEQPYLEIRSPSTEEEEMFLRVDLVPAAIHWPSELDETLCRDLDWRTFRVAIDPEQWRSFWDRPGFMSFQMGLGYTDHTAKPGKSRMPLRSFAMAMVDTTTGEAVWSCGCYEL